MKPFTVIDCAQRSPEWFAARCGRLTGSSAADMMATVRTKGEEAAKRRDLRTRLVLERLTGQPIEDTYENADMRRGIELEPEAIAAFEAATGMLVQTSGFLAHNELMIGCSLDGHFGDFEGIAEFKCPRPANHLRYLKGGIVPGEHRLQLIHNLLVTGAGYAAFCSYSPAFPEPLRLFSTIISPTKDEIDAYEAVLRQFLKEVEAEYADVSRLALAAV